MRELKVPDCYEFSPSTFPDHRGRFTAPYQAELLAETVGFAMDVRQVNQSVSARGVLRGMHFAQVPPGQAKYVHCVRGSVLDVQIDVRVGSPSFGVWDVVRLSGESATAVYLAEGIGHGFLALADDSIVSYLCSRSYNPSREHGVSALDPALGLPWPDGIEPILSEKDAAAPTLAQAAEAGLLPDYQQCQAWYAELRAR